MTKFLSLRDGFKLAYQEWGAGAPKRILALHGWLDNSNSFSVVGPKLAERGYHCVALDHAGHGHSLHLGESGNYTMVKAAGFVKEALDILDWKKSFILGHSMGAAIGIMVAGAFPEIVERLVVIEGFGAMSVGPEGTAKMLRRAIEAEAKFKVKDKLYASVKDAVDARLLSVSSYPGKQYLSREAASSLVSRGVVDPDHPDGLDDLQDESFGPVKFRHDQRLVLPTYHYHTNEQIINYLDSITASTLLITAEHGWPFSKPEMDARRKVMLDKGLLSEICLPGSHHLHLDPEHAPAVADSILEFLMKD